MTVSNLLCAIATLAAASLLSAVANAVEYHVATSGNDANDGSKDAPWKTIQKAANMMQPGDTCIVQEGIYREWVNPMRSGTSHMPITYEGAAGEEVRIKGSDQITTWELVSGQTWKAVIANNTFGTFNPYSSVFSGDYMTTGSNYHQGNVYLNGKAYSEALSLVEVETKAETWFAQVSEKYTTIFANFGTGKPNDELAEVNVRKYAIFPTTMGVDYIIIRGFRISHGATNWAPPTAYPQEGLITMNFGKGWLIENNLISDAKTICVSGGLGSSDVDRAIDQVGNHIIRHNTIERCGQAGIAGSHGLVASLIEGNLIQDISPRTTYVAGYEKAGIKVHSAIDVVIKNNIIRQVRAGTIGIWLDWQAQGSRITGNVIYETDGDVLYFEANHGPTLVDNNILGNRNVTDSSEASVFVHNLFASTGWVLGLSDDRTPDYFKPHTSETSGRSSHLSADNKYLNNIYVRNGNTTPWQPGFQSDHNVFYAGAKATSWGDVDSIVKEALQPTVVFHSLNDGVTVSFATDEAPIVVQCPLITHGLIGRATLTKQGIENHDGSQVTIDYDIKGEKRSAIHPTAGPLETIATTNRVTMRAGADLSEAKRR